MVINVVTPAMTSVRTVVLLSDSLNTLSNILFFSPFSFSGFPFLFAVVGYDGRQRIVFQTVAPMQALQLQQADDLDDLCAELLQQMRRRLQRAAGRDQVVDQDDTHAGLDIVLMDLDCGGAVL